MAGERFEVGGLACERWGDGAPEYVLLHAGIADLRSWRDVAPRLDGPAVAYDRRGFGDSPPGPEGFRHLDDLLAVLDATAGDAPGVARGQLDGRCARHRRGDRGAGADRRARPDRPGREQRRSGLRAAADDRGRAALGGGVEGRRRGRRRGAAAARRVAVARRAEHEGRVGGPARELAVAMDRRVFEHGAPDEAGSNGVDGGGRLGELRMPVTVAWGELRTPSRRRSASCWWSGSRVPGGWSCPARRTCRRSTRRMSCSRRSRTRAPRPREGGETPDRVVEFDVDHLCRGLRRARGVERVEFEFGSDDVKTGSVGAGRTPAFGPLPHLARRSDRASVELATIGRSSTTLTTYVGENVELGAGRGLTGQTRTSGRARPPACTAGHSGSGLSTSTPSAVASTVSSTLNPPPDGFQANACRSATSASAAGLAR